MKICRRLRTTWLTGLLVAAAGGVLFMLFPDTAVGAQATPPSPTILQKEESGVFQVTLQDLGYGEETLVSPFSNAQYTLRLPEGWQLLEGSYFDLNFSYTYDQIGTLPSFFGELSIIIDGQTQLIFSIKEPLLEHTQLRVPLPPELFNTPDDRQHTIELFLDASYLCELPHKARLIIHPISLFSLNYAQAPLTIDLAAYPRPFYQRAFEPDRVRFALGAEPTSTEMAGALAIAARLGDLTDNRLVISATTDLEWLDRSEAGGLLSEHLIIVGQPETNRLLLSLNEMKILPVSLHQRQMNLVSQGPASITPGKLFTYTLTVTNTTQQTATNLALIDDLPWQTQFVDCEPTCTAGKEIAGQVRWSLNQLPPNETARLTLVLRSTDALTHSIVENTATLLDEEHGPINVDTLTGTLSLDSAQAIKSSTGDKSGYFFAWQGQAVAEGDGIVQEIISPWNPRRVVLIATGLSEQAVYKASQALSFKTEFFGMSGPVALVSHVQPPGSEPARDPSTNITFAELGYGDRTVFGSTSQTIVYYFFLPSGWRLSDGSYLELSFRHSQLINRERSSSLTVLLRDAPLASIPLDEESAMGHVLRVQIPSSAVYPGKDNRLTLRVDMSPLDVCANTDSRDIWLTVNSDSYLHMEHQEGAGSHLDLGFYPRPFDRDTNLSNVLFALPDGPHPGDWEAALRLAAALGNITNGSALMPAAILGETMPAEAASDYHVIALGRPSTNLWIQRVNAQLPQPFRPGSDQIEQRIDQVTLRLPVGLSLGLVQLIPSPWDERRAFLAITGTTDEGVEWATDALINHPWDLKGNLSFVRENGIKTVDTRGLTKGGTAMAVATAVPEMTSEAITTTITTTAITTTTVTPLPPSPTPETSTLWNLSTKPERPAWLMPLAGVTGLVVIVSFAVAFWRARKRGLIRNA